MVPVYELLPLAQDQQAQARREAGYDRLAAALESPIARPSLWVRATGWLFSQRQRLRYAARAIVRGTVNKSAS